MEGHEDAARHRWQKVGSAAKFVGVMNLYAQQILALPESDDVAPSDLLKSDEKIHVVVRLRPLNDREETMGSDASIRADATRNEIVTSEKTFTFDKTFDMKAEQKDVYQAVMALPMRKLLGGFNVCVFCYGQTGAGKTWTMLGSQEKSELLGLAPRALKQIFDYNPSKHGMTMAVTVSILEIYNDHLRDLLSHENNDDKLIIRQNKTNGVYVQNLRHVEVNSAAEAGKLLDRAMESRATGSTLMNATSSRSHMIFTLTIQQQSENDKSGYTAKTCQLNLVDLAGSERADSTGATGSRLKEGAAINQSLSALGNVIHALVKKVPHIPFRDSKLTRLLQTSLGGNSSTVMIANISPASVNYEETLSTLRFANRAKEVVNKARVNYNPQSQALIELTAENVKLKAKLSRMEFELQVMNFRKRLSDAGQSGADVAAVQADMTKLEEETKLKEAQVSQELEKLEASKQGYIETSVFAAEQDKMTEGAEEALKEEVEALTTALDEVVLENQQLRDDVEGKDTALTRAQTALREHSEKVRAWDAERNAYEKNLTSLSEENYRLTNSIHQLEQNQGGDAPQLLAKIRELESEVSRLKGDLRDMQPLPDIAGGNSNNNRGIKSKSYTSSNCGCLEWLWAST